MATSKWDWVQPFTLGYGLTINRCVWCGANDYGKELVHDPECLALIYPTRKEAERALRR